MKNSLFWVFFVLFGVNGVTFGKKVWMIGWEGVYLRYEMGINDLK